jgi:hypothetical protein
VRVSVDARRPRADVRDPNTERGGTETAQPAPFDAPGEPRSSAPQQCPEFRARNLRRRRPRAGYTGLAPGECSGSNVGQQGRHDMPPALVNTCGNAHPATPWTICPLTFTTAACPVAVKAFNRSAKLSGGRRTSLRRRSREIPAAPVPAISVARFSAAGASSALLSQPLTSTP